jgi:hypothetical protein
MRALILLAVVCVATSSEGMARGDDSLPQQYLAAYLEINDAEHLEKKGDDAGALNAFLDCHRRLDEIGKTNPNWESCLILHRMVDLRAKIKELHLKLEAAGTPSASTAVIDAALNNDLYVQRLSVGPRNVYPWKVGIPISLFWIGKDEKTGSAWDANWLKENGGVDSPTDRNGFASAGHPSRVNPFYVALPFNDLAHADEAEKWVPRGWAKPDFQGKGGLRRQGPLGANQEFGGAVVLCAVGGCGPG